MLCRRVGVIGPPRALGTPKHFSVRHNWLLAGTSCAHGQQPHSRASPLPASGSRNHPCCRRCHHLQARWQTQSPSCKRPRAPSQWPAQQRERTQLVCTGVCLVSREQWAHPWCGSKARESSKAGGSLKLTIACGRLQGTTSRQRHPQTGLPAWGDAASVAYHSLRRVPNNAGHPLHNTEGMHLTLQGMCSSSHGACTRQ